MLTFNYNIVLVCWTNFVMYRFSFFHCVHVFLCFICTITVMNKYVQRGLVAYGQEVENWENKGKGVASPNVRCWSWIRLCCHLATPSSL